MIPWGVCMHNSTLKMSSDRHGVPGSKRVIPEGRSGRESPALGLLLAASEQAQATRSPPWQKRRTGMSALRPCPALKISKVPFRSPTSFSNEVKNPTSPGRKFLSRRKNGDCHRLFVAWSAHPPRPATTGQGNRPKPRDPRRGKSGGQECPPSGPALL